MKITPILQKYCPYAGSNSNVDEIFVKKYAAISTNCKHHYFEIIFYDNITITGQNIVNIFLIVDKL